MRTNRKLLVVVAIVAVFAGIVALVTTSPAQKLPAGSPQFVVQEFLNAVVDGDHVRAVDFLAADSSCTVTDFDQSYIPNEVRAELVDVAINGNSALVKVAVGIGSEGPFNSLYVENHSYRLVKTDGWLISGVPWPLYQCGMVKKP